MAILAAGRPLEALEANPGALSLRIRNQKGFVKSAWITVGAPISPGSSRVQVDALHAIYVELLTQLFEEHKEPFGVPTDRHLLLT
nr:putative diacylglycerol O-acyltransferase 2-like protein DGAT2L7P [Camelus dromedarius]